MSRETVLGSIGGIHLQFQFFVESRGEEICDSSHARIVVKLEIIRLSTDENSISNQGFTFRLSIDDWNNSPCLKLQQYLLKEPPADRRPAHSSPAAFLWRVENQTAISAEQTLEQFIHNSWRLIFKRRRDSFFVSVGADL